MRRRYIASLDRAKSVESMDDTIAAIADLRLLITPLQRVTVRRPSGDTEEIVITKFIAHSFQEVLSDLHAHVRSSYPLPALVPLSVESASTATYYLLLLPPSTIFCISV